jgi:hypothetical protein
MAWLESTDCVDFNAVHRTLRNGFNNILQTHAPAHLWSTIPAPEDELSEFCTYIKVVLQWLHLASQRSKTFEPHKASNIEKPVPDSATVMGQRLIQRLAMPDPKSGSDSDSEDDEEEEPDDSDPNKDDPIIDSDDEDTETAQQQQRQKKKKTKKTKNVSFSDTPPLDSDDDDDDDTNGRPKKRRKQRPTLSCSSLEDALANFVTAQTS